MGARGRSARTPSGRPGVTALLEVRPSRGKGRGLVALRDIKLGTVLPYCGVVRLEGPGVDTTYAMAAEYHDGRGRNGFVSMRGFLVDGNPKLLPGLRDSWKFAAYANEATRGPCNVVSVTNPAITHEALARSFKEERPVIVAFYVVARDIAAGEELTTHYGSGYPRKYKYEPQPPSQAQRDLAEDAAAAVVRDPPGPLLFPAYRGGTGT
ncbi:hypothetical protein JKP88DRAFT_157306 [Tribonema minus]|uniref:SET domain-containing protein n=1 Tax=Tribonema minus TaxID=303371 RepID=A0A836CET6_9STRA|nr:hypothetical protein JKP88DRAFT_157306 [Tribonema minus]